MQQLVIRVALASFASAVALFFWGFVFWAIIAMAISPWHAIDAGGNDQALSGMKAEFPEQGVYMYPWIDSTQEDHTNAEEKFQEQQAAGPYIKVYYAPQPPSMGVVMGAGFIHMLLCSAFAATLLALVEPLCCYAARVAFVASLGVFSFLWIQGGNAIWWHHPIDHSAFIAIYHVVSWLMAGLIIGAIVKKNTLREEQAK